SRIGAGCEEVKRPEGTARAAPGAHPPRRLHALVRPASRAEFSDRRSRNLPGTESTSEIAQSRSRVSVAARRQPCDHRAATRYLDSRMYGRRRPSRLRLRKPERETGRGRATPAERLGL